MVRTQSKGEGDQGQTRTLAVNLAVLALGASDGVGALHGEGEREEAAHQLPEPHSIAKVEGGTRGGGAGTTTTCPAHTGGHTIWHNTHLVGAVTRDHKWGGCEGRGGAGGDNGGGYGVGGGTRAGDWLQQKPQAEQPHRHMGKPAEQQQERHGACDKSMCVEVFFGARISEGGGGGCETRGHVRAWGAVSAFVSGACATNG